MHLLVLLFRLLQGCSYLDCDCFYCFYYCSASFRTVSVWSLTAFNTFQLLSGVFLPGIRLLPSCSAFVWAVPAWILFACTTVHCSAFSGLFLPKYSSACTFVQLLSGLFLSGLSLPKLLFSLFQCCSSLEFDCLP